MERKNGPNKKIRKGMKGRKERKEPKKEFRKNEMKQRKKKKNIHKLINKWGETYQNKIRRNRWEYLKEVII